MRSAARCLVSTMASLQNSMPVQAIVERRQFDGSRREPDPVERRDDVLDPVLVDADHDELLVRREPHPGRAVRLDEVTERGQHGAVDAADGRGGADVEPAVLLLVDADVVAAARGQAGGLGVGQGAVQVLGLQDLAELLHAPVRDQELQAGARAQPAVAVVAEDRDDALPDVGDVLAGDPDAELLGQHRVGRQAAADPEVEAGAVLGVVDADEGDVVDLGGAVERRVPGGGGLELARQVGVLRVADVAPLDLGQGRGGVDDLVLGDAGDRGAEEAAGGVAAGLQACSARRLRAATRSRARPRSRSSGTGCSAGR